MAEELKDGVRIGIVCLLVSPLLIGYCYFAFEHSKKRGGKLIPSLHDPALGKNVGVRISPKQEESIKRMASKYSVPDAQIIRWAIDALDQYEIQNQRLHLPIQLDE